jgi:hypothetical protein
MNTTRRYRLFALTLLSLAFLAPAEAKKANAPGIQKKIPLTISAAPLVVALPNSVTVSWLTNKESNSSISVTQIPILDGGDGILIFDPTLATEHQVSVDFLVPGANYEYIVVSTDDYGYTVKCTGRFMTPP